MPIIKSGSDIITKFNVFTVPQGEQDALIAYLTEAAHAAREVDAGLCPACTEA